MKFISVAIALIAVKSVFAAQSTSSSSTATSSSRSRAPATVAVEELEDIYYRCHGYYERTPALCKKFNFISSEEAVKKGCVNPANGTTFYNLDHLPKIKDINQHTVKMASLITNVFEDGDPNFAFASCEDIKDSRGFTSGYAGFTTGTGDAEILLKTYSNNRPGNKLHGYLPRMSEISKLPHCDRKNRGTTVSLDGYCQAWKEEACNATTGFSQLQRSWIYQKYMIPSARYAAASGVVSPLGQAIFYDTIIQHGYQYVEPDINIVRLLTLTGPRRPKETEQNYLLRFLTVRRELQCCYPDQVWPASAVRSSDLLRLVKNFNRYKDLTPPIRLVDMERIITGNEDLSRDVKRCALTK